MTMIAAILFLFTWPFSSDDQAIQEIAIIKEQMKGYYSTNLDSAAILAEIMLTKANEANYIIGQAKAEFALAYIANERGKTSQAIPHYLKALDIYLPLVSNDALIDQANICITLGSIYRQHHMLDKAEEIYEQGIRFARACNDQEALRKLFYNQSIVLKDQGKLVEGIDLLLQSLDLVKDQRKVVKQRIYNQLGVIYYELKDYDQARDWYNKMIQLESGNEPSKYTGQAYHNIAFAYRKEKNYADAWKYYTLALKEKESLGIAKTLFVTYHEMAELALAENKPELAFEYAQNALPLLSGIIQTPENYSIYNTLSRSLQNSDPKLAFAYSNLFVSENEAFLNRQKEFIAAGDKYKVQLITSNYFNKVKRQEDRLRLAWTMSCAAAFIFLAVLLTLKLYRIYSYRSPELALSHIKNQSEMIYLLDLFRKEKEEMKNTLRQKE